MQVRSIRIGDYETKNNIFLAPMASYTDYPFRKLCLELGAGLTFTELVSAKGICYKSRGNEKLLYSGDDYDKTAVQIFGSCEDVCRSACESNELAPFKIVDINMGCPVPKVYKNGDGSALLKDIHKAEKIVKECVKSGKIITVKIRTGLKKGDDIAEDFTKMAEDSGAKLVTIHGRVREDYYSGEPNFDAIYRAKKAVSIPVIANGGIYTEEDADNMMDRTGADGVMLARGAVANPLLFSTLQGKEPNITMKQFIIKLLEYERENKGEKRGAIEFRKFPAYIFRGIHNIKDVKIAILKSESISEIINLISKNL
ncbi:MAG: tRNA-dihydrouridine synthase [Firmicutes bacterium]|nr:tRNA-dihydrouridine synthase [Candidatus Caballimonas caccae]